MSDVRCLVAEQTLAQIPIPCTFQDEGCIREFLLSEIKAHETDCPFRLIDCVVQDCDTKVSFCKYLGQWFFHQVWMINWNCIFLGCNEYLFLLEKAKKIASKLNAFYKALFLTRFDIFLSMYINKYQIAIFCDVVVWKKNFRLLVSKFCIF